MKQLILIGLFFSLANFQLFSQTFGDCLGALPICDSIYVEMISPSDPGIFTDEIHEDCCISQEQNSIWYKFRIKQSGLMGFRILPSAQTFDYDWALFNITNKQCSDIADDFSLISSCNAAGGAFDCRGDTGPDGSTPFNFQNANCGVFPPTINSNGYSPFNDLVGVEEGEIYALLILEFTQGITDGFIIDFTIADDVGIYDVDRPSIIDGDLIFDGCFITGFTLEFSEEIVCNSFDVSDLSIMSEGAAQSAVLLSNECQNSELSSFFTVVFDSPLPLDSEVVVEINDDPFDLCLNPNISLELTYPGVPINDTLVMESIIICGESITLTEDLSDFYSSIEWSTGDTSQSIVVGPGEYEALLDGDCGQRLVQYTVESGQVDVELVIPSGVCNDPVLLQSIEMGEFDYILNGQFFDNFEDIPALSIGSYELEIFNDLCDTIISFELEPLESSLEINGQQFFEITFGDTVNLEVFIDGEVEDVYWLLQGDTICSTCNSLEVSPILSSEYTVVAVDSNGCVLTYTIQVRVEAKYDVYSPNIFSPNNDGINDRFTIFGNELLQNIGLIEIYDRWGELVFRGVNLNPGDIGQGWDGTFKNSSVSVGIYSYFARLSYADGFEQTISGSVTLVR